MDQKDSLTSLEEPEITENESSKKDNDDDVLKNSKKFGFTSRIKILITHFNIYLIIFIIIVIFISVFTFISYRNEKNNIIGSETPSQQLSPEELSKLNVKDTSVGDPKQTLTVQSNSIFTGKVLVRNDVDIAGKLTVGGTLNLAGIVVSGTSTLDEIQGNKLSINGDSNIQGQLTVQKGLTVSGGASFGGDISAPTITVESLQLSGDLKINRHIDAGGPSPTGTFGGALGSGGTASVGGTDTAGTITINTGGSPGAGCFITVNFARNFNAQPHIVVTPVGSDAAGLNYYINRSSNGFSLCSSNSAPANKNFAFDFIAIE